MTEFKIALKLDPNTISKFKKTMHRTVAFDLESSPFLRKFLMVDEAEFEKIMLKIQADLVQSFDIEYMKGMTGFVEMGNAGSRGRLAGTALKNAIGISHKQLSFQSHSQRCPRVGAQSFVVDSITELSKAEQALIAMSQVGISHIQAGELVKALTDKLTKLKANPEKEEPIYSKSQAHHWANKWSHKRPTKL